MFGSIRWWTAFANALNKGDAKEAKKHVLSDPESEKFIDATAPYSAARTKLLDASVAKFGEHGRRDQGREVSDAG